MKAKQQVYAGYSLKTPCVNHRLQQGKGNMGKILNSDIW